MESKTLGAMSTTVQGKESPEGELWCRQTVTETIARRDACGRE